MTSVWMKRGRLDRGMQAVVGNGQRRPRLVLSIRALRIVAHQRAYIVVRRAGTGCGRVGANDVGMDEARPGSSALVAGLGVVRAG
jgi:hypothetical protein